MARGRVVHGKRGRRPHAAVSKEAAARAGASRLPAKENHRLTDLAQMKVLADPRRIRILELLCEERTTKQVAEILGQPPTRLYHHMAALERAGLVRLARTRQRRGALEKYYQAVAQRFSADPGLFSSGTPAQVREATQSIAAQLLENTTADMNALLESGEGQGLQVLEQDGILSYLEVRGGPKEIKAIRDGITKLIRRSTGRGSKAGLEGPAYRLTIAFFPLARVRQRS